MVGINLLDISSALQKKKKKKRENAKSCWYLHDLMKEADNVLTQLGGKLLCHLFPKKCEFQT